MPVGPVAAALIGAGISSGASVGASVIGSKIASNASKSAAKTQADASTQAANESRATTRDVLAYLSRAQQASLAPQAPGGARPYLSSLLGIPAGRPGLPGSPPIGQPPQIPGPPPGQMPGLGPNQWEHPGPYGPYQTLFGRPSAGPQQMRMGPRRETPSRFIARQ